MHERPALAVAARHPDVRIAEGVSLHTKGVSGPAVIRAQPRPFLHREEHREIARDRAFVAVHGRDFHTRFVRDFSPGEMQRWRRGTWRNEWHYGRRGWWWETGGVWYGYPEPVWPYPAEVAPLTAYETATLDGPDLSALEAGSAPIQEMEGQSPGMASDAASAGPGGAAAQAGASPIQPLPAAPVGWYRCEQPGGYYPVIASCPASWVLVQNAPMPGEQ